MPDQQQPQQEGKTYSLSQSDRNFIIFIRQHLDAVFSATVSNLAYSRFAYPVTPNTQFTIDENLANITIKEKVDIKPQPGQDDQGSPVASA